MLQYECDEKSESRLVSLATHFFSEKGSRIEKCSFFNLKDKTVIYRIFPQKSLEQFQNRKWAFPDSLCTHAHFFSMTHSDQ
jgi:hypothetical protein